MPPEKKYPPSFMQSWMLKQQLSHEGLAVWNRPTPLDITGDLDHSALNKALDLLQRRHVPLHSKLNPQDQLWHTSPGTLNLQPCIDLSRLSGLEKKQAIDEHLEKLNGAVFNVTQDFPLRAQLLKLDTNHHLLSLSFHHISIDGGSITVLIEELTSLYEQVINKQDSGLPPLPHPFDQFSTEEKDNYLKRQQEFHAYHRDYFPQNPEPLKLPGYKKDPPASFRQAFIDRKLSPETSHALREFSNAQNVTLFMSLYSIFNAMIFLTTGQREIFMGTFFSDRRHVGIRKTLALLFNIVPISTSLTDTMNFRDLLAATRQRCLKAFRMSDYPYIKFMEQCETDTPLLPIIFQFRNFPKAKKLNSALTIREYPYHHAYGNFDITFEAQPVDDQISLTLSYRTDRYSENAVRNILDHYCTLVGQLLENPDKPLGAFTEK